MKNYKAPDLNAPRYRKKALSLLNADFYKEFKDKYPQYKDLDNKILKEIIVTYNGLIWENVINEREGVEFPESLGYVFIGSCTSQTRFGADHNKSVQTGVKVKNLNWDTDGKLCKIVYTNYSFKYTFRFRDLWSFTAVRQFKRSVSHAYKEQWQKYIVLYDLIKVSQVFKEGEIKMYSKQREKDLLEEYDEFEID